MTYNLAKITYNAAKEKLNNELDEAFLIFLADGKRLAFRLREKLAYSDFRKTLRNIRWTMDRIYFIQKEKRNEENEISTNEGNPLPGANLN